MEGLALHKEINLSAPILKATSLDRIRKICGTYDSCCFVEIRCTVVQIINLILYFPA